MPAPPAWSPIGSISKNQPPGQDLTPLVAAAHGTARYVDTPAPARPAATIQAFRGRPLHPRRTFPVAVVARRGAARARRPPKSAEAAALRMGDILSARQHRGIRAFHRNRVEMVVGQSTTAPGVLLAAGGHRAPPGRAISARRRALPKPSDRTKAFVAALWGNAPLLRSVAHDERRRRTAPVRRSPGR